MLTSKVNRIIQVLNLGFVDVVIDAADRLKVAWFLDINDVILDAEFRTDGFIAKNGEFDNDRKWIQNEKFVIDVFVVVWYFVHHIQMWERREMRFKTIELFDQL
jgi:hypothetical protein